ncbi:MAG: Maf family protein [Chloroflexota bacterium]
MENTILVLASNSPRRKQLLALLGCEFSVQPAVISEDPFPSEKAMEYVLRMAVSKARAIAEQVNPGALVIAVDTTVSDQDQILGKPIDADEARQILRQLRGHTHQVYTALAVFSKDDKILHSDICLTDVPMRAYSEDEMEAYIATGDPFDKTGAYAIQHKGFHPVEEITGCYANVMGLPICHLKRMLCQFGVHLQGEGAGACQGSDQGTCLVYRAVIQGEI